MTLVIEKPEGWGSTGCISLDSSTLGVGGGDLVPTMPGCMCPKVKDIGPFSALRE